MTNGKRFWAVMTVLAGLASSAALMVSITACEKKTTTTIIRDATPPEKSGVEFKVKTGDIDLEGKIPTEKK